MLHNKLIGYSLERFLLLLEIFCIMEMMLSFMVKYQFSQSPSCYVKRNCYYLKKVSLALAFMHGKKCIDV